MKKAALWALVGWGIALLVPPQSVLGMFKSKSA